MKKQHLKSLIALAAFAFLAGSIEKAHAQNNWTNTGASPGGGFIIIGNSAPTDLGPLGPSGFSSPVFLSSNGSDIITLDAGNTATSGLAEVIDLEAPGNNTLNNYGTIHGTGAYGVLADTNSNGNTLNNWGTINAVSYGIVLYSNSNVVNNWNLVTSPFEAIYMSGISDTVNNMGTVNAGSFGFEIYGTSNTVNNRGTVSSGDYLVYGGGSHITLNNWGTMSSSAGSYGIYSYASSLVLNNYNGAVITGANTYTVYSSGGSAILNNWGSMLNTSGGYTVFFNSSNNLLNNWGTISSSYDPIWVESGNHTTLNNWGTIHTGGSSYGVYNSGGFTILNNWGTISGADYLAVYDDGSNFTFNNWGTASSTDEVVFIQKSGHSTINNWGMLSSPDDTVDIEKSGHNTVNNWGTISSSSSDGILIYKSSNNIINNWGAISGGANGVDITLASHNTLNLYGHSSVTGKISIAGSSNVVNLDFSGLSPSQIAALNAVLIPQGVNSGVPTPSVQFTLRNVNYNIDPAIVNFNPSSYQTQGFTPNQGAVGVALDSLVSNPAPGSSLFNLLNAIDNSGNVPAALEALSPQKFEIYGDLAIQNATAMVLDVDQRLNNLRDGSESVDTTGLGGDNSVALTSGYSKDDSKDAKDKIVRTEPKENRWGFFATGNGSFFRANSHNVDLQEGSADSVGTLIGVDGKVGEHAVIGALFAYNNSAVTLGGDGSHATVDSYSGGLYGAYHNDGYYVNGLAAYTRNNYTSTRNIAFPGSFNSAAGSTDSNQATVNIDGGYDFHLTNRITAGPLLGLQYVHLDVDGFNETGAGAAGLSVGSQSVDSLQSRLGGRIDYKILAQPNVAFAAELHAAWQHEYLNDNRGISAGFEAPGMLPFSVQTQSPLRDSALVGADLNFTFKNRVTLFAGYDLQYWKASYINQTVNGGVRISW